MINFQLNILEQTRKNVLASISNLSIEELNTIPKGFNNNIIWNFCHLVVTLDMLCYKLSGNKLSVEEKYIEKYKKGSKLTEFVDKEEFNFLKKKYIDNIAQFKNDYQNELFKNFTKYPTSYNLSLSNIEDAISFNNVHEALHFGYILALKRAIK